MLSAMPLPGPLIIVDGDGGVFEVGRTSRAYTGKHNFTCFMVGNKPNVCYVHSSQMESDAPV